MMINLLNAQRTHPVFLDLMKKTVEATFVYSLLFSAWVLNAREQPVVLDQAVVLKVFSSDGTHSDICYYGQPSKNGLIDLTASNGFFDRCFEAAEPLPDATEDKRFLIPLYSYLKRMSDKVHGSARWHLWVAEPGELRATFYMTVPKAEAGHEWLIRIGNDTQELKAAENNGESAQPQQLTFKIAQPGKVTFSIDCTKTPPPPESRLYFVRLEGNAIKKANLLRTRWRPLAVHTRFYAPQECPTASMWVFETQPNTPTSSYSPLTTPFGYYGTLFQDNGQIAPGAGFNFSMWISGAGAKAAPPIAQMPRLIASALPDAQFVTWGGEGTGVKPRAVAYPDGATRTIQALRVEGTKDGTLTFYGYFYDERESRWKLYVAGQKYKKSKNIVQGDTFGTLHSTGSFCEIPGPPNRERSGDIVREIKRRGWFYGSDKKWCRAVLGNEKMNVQTTGTEKDEDAACSISNKRTFYMDDYAREGWIAMATGGIAYYANKTWPQQSKDQGNQPALPEYLTPEKTEQLFARPVEFGKPNVSTLTAHAVSLEYVIKKTGPCSKAILYYGTVDSLTYTPRTVTKGSDVEIDMFRPERTWQFATPEQSVRTGANPFQLHGLKGNTTYYYRLFVTHNEGKSWDYQSHSFTTK